MGGKWRAGHGNGHENAKPRTAKWARWTHGPTESKTDPDENDEEEEEDKRISIWDDDDVASLPR